MLTTMHEAGEMIPIPDTHSARLGATELPDVALIARLRAGDAGAYEILLRRYNRRLFRVTRSILRDDDDAQDAMQEAYVRAFTHLGDFRAPGNFGAWLTRIAVNEALMKKRSDKRFAPRDAAPRYDEDEIDAMAQRPAPGAGTEDLAANGELRCLIEAAVDQLPESFRTVFVLRALEHLSVEETADSLGIPAATVKTRFHRARGLMQQELTRHIDAAGLTAFDFAGARCDRMVATVLARLMPSKTSQ
jgi:RNA polymerase sigma-70 factor (ECF subfamily)